MARKGDRRVAVFVACVGTVLLALAIVGCAPPQYDERAPAPPASYYPLAVGDHWTYEFAPGKKRYDADVTATKIIDGVTTYAMAIDDAYTFMAVRPDGVYEYAQGEPEHPTNAIVFDPAQRIYKLPFVVGEDWNTPVLVDPTNAHGDIVRVYGKVESIENVTVPAGVFKGCARILIDDPRDVPSNLTELWFAPSVGIVKTETTTQKSNNTTRKYQTLLMSYNVK